MMSDQENSDGAVQDIDKPQRFWTADRVVIYLLLIVAVVAGLNDYRVRTGWESDFDDLDAAVTAYKNPTLLKSDDQYDQSLVDTLQLNDGVDQWLEDKGYTLDADRSDATERVFVTSSGLRQFWVVVDYMQMGQDETLVRKVTSVSREQYYLWEELPETEEGSGRGDLAGSSGGPGDAPMASMGGGGSGGGQGGGRSFDPEAFFAERDEDGDGLLAGDELSERMRGGLEQTDTDKDGAVSLDEFLAAIARMRASRSQGGGGGGGGGGGLSGQAGLMQLPDDPFAEGGEGELDPNLSAEEVAEILKARAEKKAAEEKAAEEKAAKEETTDDQTIEEKPTESSKPETEGQTGDDK